MDWNRNYIVCFREREKLFRKEHLKSKDKNKGRGGNESKHKREW